MDEMDQLWGIYLPDQPLSSRGRNQYHHPNKILLATARRRSKTLKLRFELEEDQQRSTVSSSGKVSE